MTTAITNDPSVQILTCVQRVAERHVAGWDDQLHRSAHAADGRHRRARAGARASSTCRACSCSRASAGRTREGAYATCHAISLPSSEPSYYFWRDRRTGAMTRRSEWFVTKSPRVELGPSHDRLPDFVLPAAILRSDDRARPEAGLVPGRRAVGGQARHDRPRALPRGSDRTRASAGCRAPTARRRRAPTARSSSGTSSR